jgi:nicotinamidase-related amidase
MRTKLRTVITAAILTGLLPGTLTGCASGRTEAAPPDSKEEERVISPRDAGDDLLLLVDFQNVYLPGYDWACPSMPEALKNTVRILEAPGAPDYVMTRFIAPADPVGRWQQYNEAYREINEDPQLAELAEALAPYAEKTTVIDKSTYSSMDAPEVLRAMEGKKAVILAGVTAECCVLATMMDAMDLGYEVVYLYDCIAGQNAELEAQVRGIAEMFEPTQITVMGSEEYLAAIGSIL